MIANLVLAIAWFTAASESPSAQPAAVAASPTELLVHANQSYDAGAYSEAAEKYVAIIEQGAATGHVYFNWGNSLLRTGKLGLAIAAYLEAKAALPRDGDVAANLAYARKNTKDAISPVEAPAALRTLFFWHYSMSRDELVTVLLVVNALLWVVLALRLRRRDSELLRWATVLLVLVVIGTAGSLAARILLPTRVAVVTAAEVEAHSGTANDTVIRFKLHEGTEVQLVDADQGWVRIRLPDGNQGWVVASDVRVVSL